MSRIANDTAKISLPESWTNVPSKQDIDIVENKLQKNITDGDTTLQNNLDAAEATLQGNIDTEVARAKAKELELQNKFNSYTPTLDIPAIKVDNATHADSATQAEDATHAINADAATKATQDGNGKDIDTTYAKVENTYNKEEVDQKVSSVYTYKGSVATKAELPTQDLTIGDVYDVKDSGINYAWNGTDWDALGMEIDLSLYAKKTDVPGIKVDNAVLADKVADNATNVSGEELATTDNSYMLSAEKRLDNGVDLNNLTEIGVYGGKSYNDKYINMPSTTGNRGGCIFVVELSLGNPTESWMGSYFRQTYKSAFDGRTWVRIKGGSNVDWTKWKEIATVENGVIKISATKIQQDGNINNFWGENYWGKDFYCSGGNTIIGKPQGVNTFHLSVRQRSGGATVQTLETPAGVYVRFFEGEVINQNWRKLNWESVAQANYSTFNYGIEGETK